MELRSRSEMDPKYTWDLSQMYENLEAYEKAFAEVEKAVPDIQAVMGTLGASAEALKHGLDTVYSLLEKAEPVYIYTMLRKSGDSSDPENLELSGKATRLLVTISSMTSFIEPEILAIPEDKITEYLKDPSLEKYRFMIENILRGRTHILDAEKEKMLAMLMDVSNAPSDAFDMLTNVDMEFPVIKDENGNDVRLTNGNFSVYRASADRRVREDAFNGYFGTHKKYINTLAELYAGSVKFDTYFADVHNFASARERALFASCVPLSVYDNLIEAIHAALPTMRRYLELRKKVLGLDKIVLFDLYTPMIEDVDYPMPYEEGKKLVKEALKPLGKEYGKLLDKAYENGWIDVYENKGKRSGAFSCGVYGTHPYVLLNYTDTLDDAFTLAHELGHSMHSYKSAETQEYVNSDYKIMVAEVASTVNEVFMTKHLLKTETDKKRRAFILNNFLEGFRTTVFRQTLFAEFEKESHEMYKNGVTLTAKSLSDTYNALISKYYEGAEVPEIMSYEWSYIPHFYNAFYVYQYATGFCSAVTIASKILETGDTSGYLKFLTLGGSDHPIEELKVAGVDLTKPDAVANAMKVFDDTVTELEELLADM